MATRAISRLYDRALEPLGLRTTHYSLLARLEVGGPDTLTHLAARLVLDRSTLSRELAPLEARGLVGIRPGEDRRQRIVELTPAGAALLDEARPAWRTAQREVRSRFGDLRSRELLDELHRLVLVID